MLSEDAPPFWTASTWTGSDASPGRWPATRCRRTFKSKRSTSIESSESASGWTSTRRTQSTMLPSYCLRSSGPGSHPPAGMSTNLDVACAGEEILPRNTTAATDSARFMTHPGVHATWHDEHYGPTTRHRETSVTQATAGAESDQQTTVSSLEFSGMRCAAAQQRRRVETTALGHSGAPNASTRSVLQPARRSASRTGRWQERAIRAPDSAPGNPRPSGSGAARCCPTGRAWHRGKSSVRTAGPAAAGHSSVPWSW